MFGGYKKRPIWNGLTNFYNNETVNWQTFANLSKLANNSFNMIISSSAVTVDEYSVKPTISANKILK